MKRIENSKQRIKSLWLQAMRYKCLYRLLLSAAGLLLLTISFNLMAPAAAGAEISITVTGNGVARPVTFTRTDLEAMPQVEACCYSTINTWPTKKWYMAEGVRLSDLLATAGILPDARLITVKSADGFKKTLTRKELEDPRYYYPGLKANHEFAGYIPGSSDNAEAVDTILALRSVEGSDDPAQMNTLDAPLLIMGQRWITEQTNELFLKYVETIEVSTTNPSQWEIPAADRESGIVPVGTRIALSTSDMDGDNIYYTTDGSDPTVQSSMYNWIKKRWWNSRREDLPLINQAIEITRNTTIKAIAIGAGKKDSDIATFTYQVLLKPAPDVTADVTDNILGRPIEISYADDADWRAAVTGINVEGTALASSQYTIGQGKITFNPGIFPEAKEYLIIIEAKGYQDVSVNQEIRPLLALTAPASGEEFTKGQQIAIKGTAEVAITSLNIKIIGPDGQIVYGPEEIGVSGGTFETSFIIGADAASGTYTITLNGIGLPVSSTGTFKVKTTGDELEKPSGDVVLTITGNGVASKLQLTLPELQAMEQYRHVYSVINTWPTKKWYVGEGVKLKTLLALAGLKTNSGLVRFTAADGYTMTLTVKELLRDSRFCFPQFKNNGSDNEGHIPGSSGGAQEVEPILALLSAEGTDDSSYMNNLSSLLLMVGQRAVTEQTGNLFIKSVNKIEVLDSDPSEWNDPRATPGSGEVPAGTLVRLSNSLMDDDKIYYTTDGSTPTINSPMYNWIASRWWSSRADVLDIINHPIEITRDTTIKAITIGPGRMNSNVATFSYQAKKAVADTVKTVIPGVGGTISLGTEASIEIPPGALQESAAVEVKIEQITAPPTIPADSKLVSSVYEFSVDGRNSYNFTRNVTIILSFDSWELEENETPAICYYDEAGDEWIDLGGSVSADTMKVQVDHFTKFAVLAVAKKELKELPPTAPSANLIDIKNHWAEKNIVRLVALDAISGYPDGSFKPDNPITRAEFTTVLVKTFKLKDKTGMIYADTAGHWAKDYIAAAAAHQIVNGYSDSLFGPDDFITREQMAVMIAKAALLSPAVLDARFTDSSSISGWARDSVAAAIGHEIIKGYPDNTIRPRRITSRAEAVTALVNALGLSQTL
ncbi:MAG: S-layer homology domain-containing protein [Syntrophomonas sp.]